MIHLKKLVELGKVLPTFFFFLPHHSAHGILVPPLEIEPRPTAVKVPSSNHWTTREFPGKSLKKIIYQNNFK